jgi:hypothetical protein
MANAFDEIRSLSEETLDYLRLRWASLRLETVERLSLCASKVLARVIAFVVLLVAAVFMMVALALWIGELLGQPSLGFLIAGGVFLVVGVVICWVGWRMFAGAAVRWFVDLFFTDNDYDNGSRD